MIDQGLGDWKAAERSRERKAVDYSISVADSKELLGVVLLPHDIRAKVLDKYRKEHGAEALVNLFSQFIGLANSVVANSHDAIELFLIVEADFHPYQAEKINWPTLFGALNGVKLAEGVNQEKTCHGCACRLGSLANQSPSTTCDVDWCLADLDKFWCHEDLDEDGKPTKKCIGFETQKRRVSSER